MNVKVFPSENAVSEELAEWICNLINAKLKRQEYFSLALSGGETPKLLYKKLASEEYVDKIDWKRLHIFWGDERMVPASDDRNNAKMAFDNLLEHTNIPEMNIHKIRVDVESSFSVEDYAHRLHHYFDNRGNTFDLILLGVGEDGHTLSIFPGADSIVETKKWVGAAYNEKQHTTRITLLPALVNKASVIAFLVTGENKADAVRQVLEGPYTPTLVPAQIIKAEKGELYWFLDSAAARKLKNNFGYKFV